METLPTLTIAADHWTQLKYEMSGEVILPEDEGYQQARLAWNLSVDQYPAVIVIPKHTDDVKTAVRFASKNGLSIAVQSTGHGIVRPADGAMLMLTSAMQDVRINSDAQTAWVAAGVRWGKVLQKAQAFGLTPLLGSSPDVGAIGYTLGGGFGWLGRKYGMAIDSVNYFEVVTVDGHRLIASEEVSPDLFWGLRGGGGSLAIVTGMEIKLYPVRTVYAGNLYYPITDAQEVFAHYREWIDSAPEELTSSMVIMNYPPIPEMPDFLRGQSYAQIRGCYCGSIEQGEQLLSYWREWRAPVVDDFKAIPFSEIATVSNDPVDPLPGLSSGAWVGELNDQVIDILIRYCDGTQGSPITMAEIRHAGGVIGRVEPGRNAYGNRSAVHLLQTVGVTPTRESHEALQSYNKQFMRALQPYLTGGVYPNFLEGVEAQERIADAYSREGYGRLQELKALFDPDNRLGYSYNILPAKRPS